jgi:hypothetical protein
LPIAAQKRQCGLSEMAGCHACGSPKVRLLCIFNDFIKLPDARTGDAKGTQPFNFAFKICNFDLDAIPTARRRTD